MRLIAISSSLILAPRRRNFRVPVRIPFRVTIVLVKIIAILLSACTLLCAQAPRVGVIEFYGLHKLSEQKLLHAVQLKAGDALPPSKGNLEDDLEKIPGVVLAHVEAACCEDGKTTLFIGIEEKGAPHLAFRSPPTGDETLPGDIVEIYTRYIAAVGDAARRGSTAEDLTSGHALMADQGVRLLQFQFIDFAAAHLDEVRAVLRNADDEEQRSMAATIIGYAPKKKEVVDDLEYAMQDPDEDVRSNALRSLNAIAVLASLDPKQGIQVSPTWFVEMLNSIVLSDRTRAANALVALTDQNNTEALDQIRARAIDSVVEMAQWKNLHYALPAFMLVGRLAGMNDGEIQKAFASGNRQPAIDIALGVQPKKRSTMGPVDKPQ